MEKLAKKVLIKYLGKFVELNSDSSLSLNFRDQNVQLQNIILKPEIFNFVSFPFNLISGKIGVANLKIDLLRFLNSSIVLTLEDVTLKFTERNDLRNFFDTHYHIDKNLIKQQIAQDWENNLILLLTQQDETSIYGKLASFVFKKIQIVVKNINFEFAFTNYSICGDVEMLKTERIPDKVDVFGGKILKILFLSTYTPEATDNKVTKKYLLLSPYTELKLILNKNVHLDNFSRPKVLLNGYFPNAKLDLDKKQYDIALDFVDYIASYYKYKNYNTAKKLISKNSKNKHWEFLKNSLDSDFTKTSVPLNVKSLNKFLRHKHSYIENYTKKFTDELDSASKAIIANLEKEYDLATIISFRKNTIYKINKSFGPNYFANKASYFSSFLTEEHKLKALSLGDIREIVSNAYRYHPGATIGEYLDFPDNFESLKITLDLRDICVTLNQNESKTTVLKTSGCFNFDKFARKIAMEVDLRESVLSRDSLNIIAADSIALKYKSSVSEKNAAKITIDFSKAKATLEDVQLKSFLDFFGSPKTAILLTRDRLEPAKRHFETTKALNYRLTKTILGISADELCTKVISRSNEAVINTRELKLQWDFDFDAHWVNGERKSGNDLAIKAEKAVLGMANLDKNQHKIIDVNKLSVLLRNTSLHQNCVEKRQLNLDIRADKLAVHLNTADFEQTIKIQSLFNDFVKTFSNTDANVASTENIETLMSLSADLKSISLEAFDEVQKLSLNIHQSNVVMVQSNKKQNLEISLENFVFLEICNRREFNENQMETEFITQFDRSNANLLTVIVCNDFAMNRISRAITLSLKNTTVKVIQSKILRQIEFVSSKILQKLYKPNAPKNKEMKEMKEIEEISTILKVNIALKQMSVVFFHEKDTLSSFVSVENESCSIELYTDCNKKSIEISNDGASIRHDAHLTSLDEYLFELPKTVSSDSEKEPPNCLIRYSESDLQSSNIVEEIQIELSKAKVTYQKRVVDQILKDLVNGPLVTHFRTFSDGKEDKGRTDFVIPKINIKVDELTLRFPLIAEQTSAIVFKLGFDYIIDKYSESAEKIGMKRLDIKESALKVEGIMDFEKPFISKETKYGPFNAANKIILSLSLNFDNSFKNFVLKVWDFSVETNLKTLFAQKTILEDFKETEFSQSKEHSIKISEKKNFGFLIRKAQILFDEGLAEDQFKLKLSLQNLFGTLHLDNSSISCCDLRLKKATLEEIQYDAPCKPLLKAICMENLRCLYNYIPSQNEKNVNLRCQEILITITPIFGIYYNCVKKYMGLTAADTPNAHTNDEKTITNPEKYVFRGNLDSVKLLAAGEIENPCPASLFGGCEAVILLEATASKTYFNLSIPSIKINEGIFDRDVQFKIQHKFLETKDISVEYIKCANSQTKNVISVFVEPIRIKLTRDNIAIFQAILKSVSVAQNAEETDLQKGITVKDKAIEQLTFKNVGYQIEESHKDEPQTFSENFISVVKIDEIELVFLKKKQFLLNDKRMIKNVPVISASVKSLSLESKAFGDQNLLLIKARISAFYQNYLTNRRESLIEPNEIRFMRKVNCYKVVQLLNSENILNTNVTSKMIVQIKHLINILRDNSDDKNLFDEKQVDSTSDKHKIVRFINQTDFAVYCSLETRRIKINAFTEELLNVRETEKNASFCFEHYEQNVLGKVDIKESHKLTWMVIPKEHILELNLTMPRTPSSRIIRKLQKQKLQKTLSTRGIATKISKNRSKIKKTFSTMMSSNSSSNMGNITKDQSETFGRINSPQKSPGFKTDLKYYRTKTSTFLKRTKKDSFPSFLAVFEVQSNEIGCDIFVHSGTKVINETDLVLKIDHNEVKPLGTTYLSFGIIKQGSFLFEVTLQSFYANTKCSVNRTINIFRKENFLKNVRFDSKEIKSFFCFNLKDEFNPKTKCRTILIRAPTVVSNLLAEDIKFFIKNVHSEYEQYEIKSGLSCKIYKENFCENLNELSIPKLGYWSKNLRENFKKTNDHSFVPLYDTRNREFRVSMDIERKDNQTEVVFYVKYWIIDYTHLNLEFSKERTNNLSALKTGKESKKNSENKVGMMSLDQKENLYCRHPMCSEWSGKLLLNAVGSINTVEDLNSMDEKRKTVTFWDINYKIKFGKDDFFRTKIIEFFPKFVIKNKLPFGIDIFYKGNKTEKLSLEEGQKTTLFYKSDVSERNKEKRRIYLQDTDTKLEPSNYFRLDEVGETLLKMYIKSTENNFAIVSLKVVLKNATYFGIFYIRNKSALPYLIENITFNQTVQFCQDNIQKWHTLHAGESMYFTWDKPKKDKRLCIKIEGENESKQTVTFTRKFATNLTVNKRSRTTHVFILESALNMKCVVSDFTRKQLTKSLKLVPSTETSKILIDMHHQMTLALSDCSNSRRIYRLKIKILKLETFSGGQINIRVSAGENRVDTSFQTQPIAEQTLFLCTKDKNIKLRVDVITKRGIMSKILASFEVNGSDHFSRRNYVSLNLKHEHTRLAGETLLKLSIEANNLIDDYGKALLKMENLIREMPSDLGNSGDKSLEKAKFEVTLSEFECFGFDENEQVKTLTVSAENYKRSVKIFQSSKECKLSLILPVDTEICFELYSKNLKYSGRFHSQFFHQLTKKRKSNFRRNTDFFHVHLDTLNDGKIERKTAPRFLISATEHVLQKTQHKRENYSIGLKGFGLSVVNKRYEELVYVSLSEISFALGKIKNKIALKVLIGSFQIDVALKDTLFTKLVSETIVFEKDVKAFLNCLAIVDGLDSWQNSLLALEYFSLLIQEVDIELEEKLIIALVDFYFEIIDELNSETQTPSKTAKLEKANQYALHCFRENKLEVPDEKEAFIGILYVHLNPLALNISIQLAENTRVTKGMRNTRLKKIAGFVASAVGNIDLIPFRFKALFIENAHGTVSTLLAPIAMHYRQNAVFQGYKVVGSLDLIGNPVRLVNNIGDGVFSLFYYPAQGFVKSPKEFAGGMSVGAIKFISSSFSGVFGSAHKIMGKLAEGVDNFTQDDEYLEQCDRRRANSNLAHGFATGASNFAQGIYKGISGVVTKPVQGAHREGVSGFIKGMGKGVIGVVTKPVAGALQMASDTLEGISKTPEYLLKKARLAEGPKGVVRPARALQNGLGIYNEENALAQRLVREIPLPDYSDTYNTMPSLNKSLANEVFCKVFILMKSDNALILSNRRFFVTPLVHNTVPETNENVMVFPIDELKEISRNKYNVQIRGKDSIDFKNLKCSSVDRAKDLFEALSKAVRRMFPKIVSAYAGSRSSWIVVTEILRKRVEERHLGVLLRGEFAELLGEKFDVAKRGKGENICLVVVYLRGEEERQKIFFNKEPVLLDD